MEYRFPVGGSGFLLSLAALMGAGLALLISRVPLPLTLTAFFCLVVLVLAVMARELLKAQRDIFNPVFFISFLFGYFLLLPVFDRLVLFRLYPNDTLLYEGGLCFIDLGPKDDYLVFKAVLICLVGVLMFYAGFYSNLAKGLVNSLGLRASSLTAGLRDMGLRYLFLGAALTYILIREAGGLAGFISTKWSMRYDEGASIINNLGLLQRVILVIGSVSLLVYAAEKKSRLIFGLWFVTAMASMVFLILEGGRRVLVELIISLLVAWHYKVRRITVKTIVVIAMLLFLLVPMLDVFRTKLSLGSDMILSSIEESDKLLMLRMNTEYNGDFDILVNLVSKVPDEFNYVYGVSFVKPFLSIIPRAIWPDKPLSINQLVAEKLYPGEEGFSVASTVIGESYLNLGIPAVVLVMFLFGIMARATYMYFKKNPNNNAATLVYACLFPMLFEFFRGPVSDVVLMTVIQILLLSPLIKVVNRQPVTEGLR